MVELEQALGGLPDDPTVAPEPFAGIVARAERRRRRRWQGRGAAAVVALLALAIGIPTLVADSPQVVDTATSPGGRRELPATVGGIGSAAATVGAAMGEVGFRAPGDGFVPADEIAAPPSPSTSVEPDTRVPPTAPDPDGSQSSPIQPIDPEPLVPPVEDPSLTACPAAQVAVAVSTGKATFAVGETVTGSSVLENRSGTACLVPARVFFAVENSAGEDVGGFAYTADYRFPVKAEPGQSFAGSFTWDQTNCGGPACTRVPAGTYTAVGRWTEGGSFSARATFQIGP
jgi:hypothetical protein